LALLEDGVPTLVLEEERFNREKHTRRFPFRSLKAAFDDRDLSLSDVDVVTTPWHMRSLWRMMFGVVRDGFPASLNLVPPSARPTQSTLIVTMPNGLRWGLLWHFGAKGKLPTIV
jgi:carbamoyltransferase